MSFIIDYQTSEIISVDKIYTGALENGHRFHLYANWTERDGWIVDSIVFEADVEISVKEEIAESFMQEMNGYID